MPDQSNYTGFNPLTWFISDLMFLYVLFPFVFFLLLKAKLSSIKNFFLPTAALCFYAYIYVVIYKDNVNVHYNFYISPFIRLIEFISGMILAIIYVYLSKIKKFVNLVEVTALNRQSYYLNSAAEIITVIIIFLFILYAKNIHQTYRFSLYFLPVLTFAIIVFLLSKGLISGFLSNRWIVGLGNNSYQFLMFHFIVMRYYLDFLGIFPYKHPLLTAFLIFSTSYLLVLVCNNVLIIFRRFSSELTGK